MRMELDGAARRRQAATQRDDRGGAGTQERATPVGGDDAERERSMAEGRCHSGTGRPLARAAAWGGSGTSNTWAIGNERWDSEVVNAVCHLAAQCAGKRECVGQFTHPRVAR